VSVRLFHKGARLVLVIRRAAPGSERWWALCWTRHDWRSILLDPLLLVGLDPRSDGPRSLVCRIGRLEWTEARRWATIDLRLDGGSATKRQLVAAALLKAARYGRPGMSGH
jgi:hypothetical protein